jgi:hypothetical protein
MLEIPVALPSPLRHHLLMKPLRLLPLLLVAALAYGQGVQAAHAPGAASQSAEPASRNTTTLEDAAHSPAAFHSLPDPVELVRRLKANQKQLEERRKDYVCDFTEETRALDSKGTVKKTETNDYELFFDSGYPITRQMSKGGKPLDEHEAQKEEQRVDEEIKKARDLAARHARDNDENPDEIRIDHILHATVMKNGRYETYRGREALVYDFEPNPQFKPHTRAESLANKLGGTVWIDAQDVEVARLEARLIDNFRVAGGLLGSVKTGSDLIIEQERVNGEVWLPSFLDFSLDARIMLVKSVHEHILDHFSSYRKFRVETTIKPAE